MKKKEERKYETHENHQKADDHGSLGNYGHGTGTSRICGRNNVHNYNQQFDRRPHL